MLNRFSTSDRATLMKMTRIVLIELYLSELMGRHFWNWMLVLSLFVSLLDVCSITKVKNVILTNTVGSVKIVEDRGWIDIKKVSFWNFDRDTFGAVLIFVLWTNKTFIINWSFNTLLNLSNYRTCLYFFYAMDNIVMDNAECMLLLAICLFQVWLVSTTLFHVDIICVTANIRIIITFYFKKLFTLNRIHIFLITLFCIYFMCSFLPLFIC